jgi:hypothetical protein
MKKLILVGVFILLVAVAVFSQTDSQSLDRIIKQNFLVTASICGEEDDTDCYLKDNAYFATGTEFRNQSVIGNLTGPGSMYFVFGTNLIKPEIESIYSLISADWTYGDNAEYYLNDVMCANVTKERNESWGNRIVIFEQDCVDAVEIGLNKYNVFRYRDSGNSTWSIVPSPGIGSAPIITGTEWATG